MNENAKNTNQEFHTLHVVAGLAIVLFVGLPFAFNWAYGDAPLTNDEPQRRPQVGVLEAEPVMRHQIMSFYEGIFSLPNDPTVFYRKLQKYNTYLVPGSSSEAVYSELRRLGVNHEVGTIQYECTVDAIALVGKHTWQVDYTRTRKGAEKTAQHYRSQIVFSVTTPTTDTAMDNPLGLQALSFETIGMESPQQE